ncbi:cell division protein ZapC [Shewanella sp. NFH-SH190041]|uniref:cell division protein ZapC n=1 Tax=Shewanella sp. NFH-SH190041 TaxID=2950245 RepID=UPI0021C2DC0F|nr:cell division protein ZapC [Shewanella sp. NFH-SH190041]BDM64662.1 cell division protein ZapC [Shewanella sp. NFH-SH190041]
MLLMPQQDWQWRYNETYQTLSVSLGSEMEFLTPYHEKLLIPDAKTSMEFNMEHARFYICMLERLRLSLTLTDAELVQIVLNATAAHFMLQPQMPKSWFFDVCDICVYCDVGKVFELRAGQQRVLVLVVENGLQAAQVILLSDECHLSETKVLRKFDSIKVMHNRLMPAREHRQVIAA